MKYFNIYGPTHFCKLFQTNIRKQYNVSAYIFCFYEFDRSLVSVLRTESKLFELHQKQHSTNVTNMNGIICFPKIKTEASGLIQRTKFNILKVSLKPRFVLPKRTMNRFDIFKITESSIFNLKQQHLKLEVGCS